MGSSSNVQQCREVVDGRRCSKPYPHYGPCEALTMTMEEWWEQDGEREEANRRLSNEEAPGD